MSVLNMQSGYHPT